MAEENLDPKQKPHWTKPLTTNVIGIDLAELSEKDLEKLISLMEEIKYTPVQILRKTP